jgi:putative spermidine/putrescine transport system substrate-binding protein
MKQLDSSVSRRRFLLGAAGVAGAAILTACGGSSATNTPPVAPTVAKSAATSAPAGTTAPAATTGTSATTAPSVAASTGPVTLAFYLGGDVNIQDLWTKNLLPMYKKVQPNVSFDFVFSEHGIGDQGTFDRIAAAKQAGKPSGVDIWETGNLLVPGGEAGIIQKLSPAEIANLAKVSPDALGQIGGYGVPYRASSVVLAYNSKDVPNPPKTIDTILDWIKANPGKFTYNPPDTGGSGDAFVTRVLKKGIKPEEEQFFQTSYDQSREAEWDMGWGILKGLAPSIYQKGFYPKGNVPVLQTLGKGEISLAPVWSDQGLSYLAQKLLPPEVKLQQIDPPFSGGAAYVGVVADSQHKTEAYAFLNWVLTPEPQTLIVNQINGYPGLDWQFMPPDVQQKYADIAKNYSFNFSQKFNNDKNQQWYEKVAGTPAPTKTP